MRPAPAAAFRPTPSRSSLGGDGGDLHPCPMPKGGPILSPAVAARDSVPIVRTVCAAVPRRQVLLTLSEGKEHRP